MGQVSIKDNNFLARDLFSKGVVNTNSAAYQRAIRVHAEAKKRAEVAAAEKKMVANQLNNLSQDVSELKQTVQELAGMMARFLEVANK